jgi:hypothetical protein
MPNVNGLLAAQPTHSAPSNSYYLAKGETIVAPTIETPLTLQSSTEAANPVPAEIVTRGADHPNAAYIGSIGLNPGGNATAADGSVGLTLRTAAGGVAVEVGTNGQAVNQLLIAGPAGLGQVYDEIYNQPVALSTITIVASDPDCTPTGGAEIFRCTQTAVAQAGAGTQQFNRIQVPRTGAYMMQTEIRMGNGPGANTVVLPSTLVGGVPVWNALYLGMQEFSTVIATPYSSVEVIGGDFQAIDTFESNSLTIRVYSQVVFLDSTLVYAITLGANSPLWNIGSAGQIKCELIAMC